jgi:putative addiction module CopG family antidote
VTTKVKSARQIAAALPSDAIVYGTQPKRWYAIGQTMEITIPKSLEALVRRKVEDGHYSTEDEVVADALRLMQARDEVAEIKRARLKDAIDHGYEDAAARKVIRFETDDQIDAFFADL